MNEYPIRGAVCWDEAVFTESDEQSLLSRFPILDFHRARLCGECFYAFIVFVISGEDFDDCVCGGVDIRYATIDKATLVAKHVNEDTFDRAVNHCKNKERSYWREI